MNARPLVIIPAYNEEESLPAVLKELAEQTPDYDVARRVRRLHRPHRRLAHADGRPRGHAPVQPRHRWARCAPASRTRCGTATSARCSSTPTGSTTRSRCARCSTASTEGADLVIGSRFAEGGAVTYEVSGIRRIGDEGAAVAGAGRSWASASPTPAPGSARSRVRCSSTSRRTTRSSTWTRSRRWCWRATRASTWRRCRPTCEAAPAVRPAPAPQARLLLRAPAGRPAGVDDQRAAASAPRHSDRHTSAGERERA